MFLKRSIFTALPLLIIGVLLAACGGPSTPTGSGSTPTTAPTTAPAAVVMTASATVGGKQVTILTDSKGFALYWYKPDTATTSSCTGGCASNWPPLAFSGSGSPTSSTTLPGTLSVVTSANGAQVQYQGHFLYTFAGDTAAGQVNGDGKGGVWFVATTDLAAMGSSNVVMTASATVGGKQVTILTNSKGFALYWYKPDTATTSSCTGGCASNWPPLAFSGSGSPTSSTTLPGTLSVVTSANGAQVQYQGHFLYTFAADTAAGQVNGDGKGGVWFVATTDLAALSTTSNGY